mmetsp:Transcript_12572/g.35615  ORF Transcript_12572/g.35615 Transcript_12572/m.35615 type:complete len:225 (+) Transcript_12572:329-1003(+)
MRASSLSITWSRCSGSRCRIACSRAGRSSLLTMSRQLATRSASTPSAKAEGALEAIASMMTSDSSIALPSSSIRIGTLPFGLRSRSHCGFGERQHSQTSYLRPDSSRPSQARWANGHFLLMTSTSGFASARLPCICMSGVKSSLSPSTGPGACFCRGSARLPARVERLFRWPNGLLEYANSLYMRSRPSSTRNMRSQVRRFCDLIVCEFPSPSTKQWLALQGCQ